MRSDENQSGFAGAVGETPALKAVHVEGRLKGLMLHMNVRQKYRNDCGHNIEAVYTFPLAWGATLLGMNVEINGKRLQAAVLEKKQASANYEKAIDEGDTPVMVKKSADGLYTANLGNLLNNEEAVIELEYAQLMHFEQDQIRITVPTVVGPRYGDEHKTGGLETHESTGANLLVEYPLTIKMTLTGDMAKASVQCPTHAATLAAREGELEVTLNQGGFLDRDFVILLKDLQGKSFASVSPDEEEFTAIASFCPTLPVQKPHPLRLKVLVDCSGSMGGDSINAARKALHEILKDLNDQDGISYSRFGSSVVHDLPGIVPCNPGYIQKVTNLIANTQADLGGTEMAVALESTFELGEGSNWRKLFDTQPSSNEQQDVLLITDGDIWDVEGVIQSAKKSGHRIFAVGEGSSPAESLLRQLANKTGGACELVSPNQNLAQTIVRLVRRLRSPRCCELKVDWGQPVIWQSELPTALYGGDTVHIFARMTKRPNSAPKLSWVANEVAMSATLTQMDSSDSLVAQRLAASQQITDLNAQVDSKPERLALALKYQLVTDETNLLLVYVRAETEKATGLPALNQTAQMLAAGWGGVGSVTEEPVRHGTFYGGAVSHAVMSCEPPMEIYDSLATPSVWRTSDRTSAQARVDSLSTLGADNFEIPAFLRKQAQDSDPVQRTKSTTGSIIAKLAKAMRPKPRTLDVGPVVTPIELLKAFDDASVQSMAVNRFVSRLQALNIPKELTTALDDLSTSLGSGANAWAVVIKWLAEALSDQFILSRQGERMLRQLLTSMSSDALDIGLKQIESQMGPAGEQWHAGKLDQKGKGMLV